MKKITILSLMMIFSIGLFAQSKAYMPKAETIAVKEDVSVSITRYADVDDLNYVLKDFGDVIYSDDFGAGGPGASDLPTGWSSVDMDGQGNNYTWQWTDVGAQGPTTGGYEYVLASTSSANGWMILDSDNYGQGSYDSYLYSPIFDLTAYDAVAITIEELYQRWGNESANPYGDNATFVGVSNDGGVTFTEYEIHADFDVKESTDNPGAMMINISNVAGYMANVQIYFRIRGLWDYWWQFDDFKIIEGAHNNLVVAETYVSSAYDFGTGVGLFGYYSMMPLSQVTAMHFESSVFNGGVDAQTNVTLTCEVLDGAVAIFTQTADTSVLASDSTISLIPDYFTAIASADLEVSFSVDQTEVEEYPIDNVSEPTSWKVTDNKIMARDVFYSRGLSPSMYTDGADGDLLGLDFLKLMLVFKLFVMFILYIKI